jgi:farnesyl diphosphate synthase
LRATTFVLSASLQGYVTRAEQALERALTPDPAMPETLLAAMRYATLGGGKRLRPLLCYSAAALIGTPGPACDQAAAAVEIVHAYSLVHDDLPAMDNDALRRGQPTCHIAFGEAMAILAGDALQALAFEVLAAPAPGLDPAVQLNMLALLGSACGALGMAGGQALDLAAVGQRLDHTALERMHALKTGALFRAALRLGLYAQDCADPRWHAALDAYGQHFGLAFQIHDDVLDVTGDTAVIGKPQGSDAAQDKPTYPAILGLDAARRLAVAHRDQAIAALDPLPGHRDHLVELADYAVRRER